MTTPASSALLHASTFLTRSPTALLSRLTQLAQLAHHQVHHQQANNTGTKNPQAPPPMHAMFALSATPSMRAPDLEILVQQLTAGFSNSNSSGGGATVVGCLSAPLRISEAWANELQEGGGGGVTARARGQSEREKEKEKGGDMIACSVALFDAARSRAFRSTIPGREQVQVGRWHAVRRPNTVDGDGGELAGRTAEDWTRAMRWDRYGAPAEGLPDELRHLEPEEVESVFYFSDFAFEGLAQTTATRFSNATQLGLIATSTPFITERPVTLFHGGRIYGDGAVGIATLATLGTTTTMSTTTAMRDHPSRKVKVGFGKDVHPFSDVLRVGACEGNMITGLSQLDDDDGRIQNPTRLLLEFLRSRGGGGSSGGGTLLVFKEEEIYCGWVVDGKVERLYPITAGDPARGAIALEATARAPPVGAAVQFYYRRRPVSGSGSELGSATAAAVIPKSKLVEKNKSGNVVISFFASPDLNALSTTTINDKKVDRDDDGDDSRIWTIENRFCAASENGFVVGGKAGEAPWACKVDGSEAEWGLTQD